MIETNLYMLYKSVSIVYLPIFDQTNIFIGMKKFDERCKINYDMLLIVVGPICACKGPNWISNRSLPESNGIVLTRNFLSSLSLLFDF